MTSHVAGIIILLRAQVFDPVLKGASPVPVKPTFVFPWVTVREAAGRELQSLTGPSGLVETLMQINVWSKDYDEAYALRSAIKSYLLPYTGAAGSENIQGVTHHLDSELSDDQRELHQAVLILKVWWGVTTNE